MPPHLHAPPLQLSDRESHTTLHWPPSAPHWLVVGGLMHVPPEQQPLPHVAALQPWHVWPTQVCAPHDWHSAPPLPHAVFALPATHVPFTVAVQQPDGHEAALHTHWPPTQRWLAPHATPPPQRHAPPAQPLAVFGSQAAHVLPFGPHWLALCAVMQLPFGPVQQPDEHEAALQTQTPPEHC